MSDNYVLDILLSDDNYMNTGFSKKQWDSLQKLINGYHHPPAAPPQQSPASPSTSPSAPLAAPQTSPPAQPAQPAPAAPSPASPPAQKPATPAYLSHEQVDRWLQMLEKCQAILAAASPPAHKLAVSIPSELPPQPISTPVPAPISARSYPPSPSVEDEEEVEQKQVYKPLRDIKQMRQKFGAAKIVSRNRVSEIFGNHTGWPAKFGGIYMCFSRDEEPDAWYTTMLNHKQKLCQIWLSAMQVDATNFLAI